MVNRSTHTDLKRGRAGIAALAFMIFAFAAQSFGQDGAAPVATPEPQAEQAAPATQTEPAAPAAQGTQTNAPLIDDINGITLGMTANEVRDKLGKPDSGNGTSLYYELKNGQQIQLQLDAEKKVTMVAGIYTGAKADAPEFAEVFGPDKTPQPQENGNVYQRVRYSEAGYWVAYNKVNLEDGAMVIVSLQKIGEN